MDRKSLPQRARICCFKEGIESPVVAHGKLLAQATLKFIQYMEIMQCSATNFWSAISSCGNLPGRFVEDADGRVASGDFLGGSSLYGRGEELEGRSVLLATTAQITTSLALAELDCVARQIILWPPDLSLEHLSFVIDTAEVDSIVSDRAITHRHSGRPVCYCPCSRIPVPATRKVKSIHNTEWILLTSGTTGRPKLVVHTFASLTSAIQPRYDSNPSVVWSTFYDIRRYGGLQILLRAALTGTSLVLCSAEESVADFLARAARAGVSHISGTPSHWRRALMSPSAELLKPQYIRLSGEAVDQALLNNLRSAYPGARIVHAFASTEAGVAFEVTDGMVGFPASSLKENPQVEMGVEDGTLRIRSAGNARCYLGDRAPTLKDQTGFVDTGDTVELRDGRYYFAGRRDGVINVGGLKVHPEEVESVIARHPEVQMCLVHGKKNPITGALVVADVVLKKISMPDDRDTSALGREILQLCRESLPAHKVPAAIKLVSELPIAESGKVMRRYA